MGKGQLCCAGVRRSKQAQPLCLGPVLACFSYQAGPVTILTDGRCYCHKPWVCPPWLQLWNANPCSGVVAVMNLQGASWDRSRRRFYVHNASPPPLTTTVRVTDVEPFRAFLSAAGADGAAAANGHAMVSAGGGSAYSYAMVGGTGGSGHSGGTGQRAGNGLVAAAGGKASRVGLPEWVVHERISGKLQKVAWNEELPVTLKGQPRGLASVPEAVHEWLHSAPGTGRTNRRVALSIC